LVHVFLVLPDLSESKLAALELARSVEPRVLVSYSTFLTKPGSVARLGRLAGAASELMLDSGAYHHARGVVKVSVGEYAGFASRHRGLFDLVVAPDVPGDPEASLERTLEFLEAYGGPVVPVAQPPPEGKARDHARQLEALEANGLLDSAPRPRGRPLVGVGGLDGERKRAAYLAELVREISDSYGGAVDLHLFGVGARLLRSLARRHLLDNIYSVDTGAWQAEIRYRRRTVYAAESTLEANLAAITGYVAKAAAAVEA